MKFTFTLRGEPVTLTRLDGVAAVRPSEEVRSAVRGFTALATRFGEPVADTSDPEVGFGLGVPGKDVKAFRSAGWVFCEPTTAVARAADNRGSSPGADAVRAVFVDRGGNTLVGTDLLAVRLPPAMTAAAVREKLRADGFTAVRALKFAPNLYEVRFARRAPYAEAVAQAQALGGYEYVEPSFLEVIGGRWTPADPDYARQWQHKNDGSNGGTAGADIKSEAAWDATRGGATPNGRDRPVRVAVIDNGMQVNHSDLKAGVVRGGYFEDDGLGGATFVAHAPGAAGFPNGNHGTFCLGMAGARANNARGGCGSAPEADLIAVACLGDQIGSQVTLARAVAYAANPATEDATATPGDGADVISCSLGPNGADWAITSVLSDAITAAATTGRGGRGVPIFWAVTNGSFEIKFDKVASHPLVVGVGRSNRLDLADGSGYGPELAFLAPGRDVYNTKQGGTYGLWTGTSFATPLAAGVAGLVIARYPALTRDEVVARMKANCDKIGGVVYDVNGHHVDYGHGRVNAERAVS